MRRGRRGPPFGQAACWTKGSSGEPAGRPRRRGADALGFCPEAADHQAIVGPLYRAISSPAGAGGSGLEQDIPPSLLIGHREEVTRGRILPVGNRLRHAVGQVTDGGQQNVDVVARGPKAGAGSNGAGNVPVITSEHFVPVGVDLVVGQSEQSHHVGVGAEAPMTHGDPILGAEPGRHQGVVHAIDGERGDRQRFHR